MVDRNRLDKNKLVEAILDKLHHEIATLKTSARAAHEAATHEESKAEDSHDTRGLEASYLAGAQAVRIDEIHKLISLFKFLPTREFKTTDLIDAGALVELEFNGKRNFYFLAAQGGGITAEFNGNPMHVITAQTPLGEELIGKKLGSLIEVETPKGIKEYRVINIW